METGQWIFSKEINFLSIYLFSGINIYVCITRALLNENSLWLAQGQLYKSNQFSFASVIPLLFSFSFPLWLWQPNYWQKKGKVSEKATLIL